MKDVLCNGSPTDTGNLFVVIFNTCSSGLIVCDKNQKIIQANNTICSISGYSSDEICSYSLDGFLCKICIKKNFLLSEITDDLPTKKLQKEICTKQKNNIWVELKIIEFETSDKNVFYIVEINDITTHKLLESKQDLDNCRWKQIFEAIGHPAVLLDINHKIIDANIATLEYAKKSKKDLLGLYCFEIFHNDNLTCPIAGCPVKKMLKSENLDSIIKEMPTKDGNSIISCSPIKDKQGNLINILHISADISDLKKLEKELLLSKQKLEEQNEIYKSLNEELKVAKLKAEESDMLKSTFLANLSHEIRTPMNGILGFTDLLKENKYNSNDFYDFLDIIESSGQRLLSIINDIIEMSKLDTNQIKVFNSNTNINSIIYNIYNELNVNVSKDTNIKLRKFIPADTTINIKTDATKLYQIICNLVNNALKFTDEGYVEFGYSDYDKDYITFYVKDTGPGIAPKYFDTIFDRFSQLQENHGKKSGSGLGLAICKAYIELLNGNIWVESEKGKGTTFYFKIPNIKCDNIEINNKEKNNTTNFVLKDILILIVEDDDVNFHYLNELFSLYDVNIIRASSGSEAVAQCISNEHIDLILMDIKLPEMNGYQATKRIKEIAPHIPIIVQTAYSLANDKAKAYECGCDDFISKPISRTKLMDIISNVFERKL
jgi:PAS domain S-box-containing protein